MKRIELFVFHHADRAVDDRVYVSAAPPGPERAAEQREKGYLAFRLEAALPGVEDGATTAVQCSELGAAAALVRDADAKATEQRKILWDLCQREWDYRIELSPVGHAQVSRKVSKRGSRAQRSGARSPRAG